MLPPFAFIKKGVAAPVLSSLNFDLADTAGGDSITITGTGLGSATSCEVGSVGSWTAATITANTPTSLTFTMPAKSAGSYSVRVTTAGGTSNTLSIEAWNPASITGIAGYFDSNLGLTLSGTDVTDWATQFGTKSASTDDPAARPAKVTGVFGNSPGLLFVPQDRLQFATRYSFATGVSVFGVTKHTSSDTTPGSFGGVPLIVLGDHAAVTLAFGYSGGALAANPALATTNTVYTRGSGFNDGNARLGGITWSSSTSDITFYMSGAQVGAVQNVTYGTCGFNRIGNGNAAVDGWDGHMGAVVLVSGVISSGDHAKLYRWAKCRFGAV